MKVTIVPGCELGSDLPRVWREMQMANPELASPYFCPEFAQAVATVRDDVEVAVIEEGNKTAALFAFQRSGTVGLPVGGGLSDYHGLICKPGFECDPRELIRKCGLVTWDFNHLLASQECFSPFHLEHDESPQIDLSRGFEAYASERKAVRREQIKMRRMERDIGSLRFVAHASDPGALRQTLAWKSQQYIRTGFSDLFSLGWARAIVETILEAQSDTFAGMLSLLYAGDRLVAGHFGMRSRTVWHWWFPSYDPAMAKYSPGLILLLKMAEHAPSVGLRTIDLGRGKMVYKDRLKNAAVPLAIGSVELPSWLSFRRTARRHLRALVLRTPFGPSARLAMRALRRLR